MIYCWHWSWKVVLSVVGFFAAAMIWAGNRHAARVAAYRRDHPNASPVEIEDALLEQSIDRNLEILFTKMKGRTHNKLGFPIYWYRDKLGRARYTPDPHSMRHTRFDHWLKEPPTEFRAPSSTLHP